MTDTRPLVSIVANFYNSASFIPKLVKSVLAQTYGQWELIAVNDCSPGRDREVLERWAATPEARGRIRVINNPANQGITRAKQTGIAAATGEYITFIDGDDWLAPDALATLLRAMTEHRVDIVSGEAVRVFPPAGLRTGCNYRPMRSDSVDYGRVIEHDEIMDRYYIAFFGITMFASYAYWGRLYRTELVKSISMPRMCNTAYEDVIFNMLCFERARRIVFIPDHVYYWRWGGTTSGASRRSTGDYRARGVIEQFACLYDMRMKKIEEHSFRKGIDPLRIELKNVLVAALAPIARYATSDPRSASAKATLEWTFSLPQYMDMAKLPPGAVERHRIFSEAYASRDIDRAYEYLHTQYRLSSRSRLMRRIASLFS